MRLPRIRYELVTLRILRTAAQSTEEGNSLRYGHSFVLLSVHNEHSRLDSRNMADGTSKDVGSLFGIWCIPRRASADVSLSEMKRKSISV